MRKLKIISEEHKFMEGVVEGKFTLSNKRVIEFEISDDYCNQWRGSKKERGETVDRLLEIQSFYFHDKISD